MLALSLVTVNLSARTGPWLLFPWRFAVGAPLLALLGAGLAATAGVLVSLRAPTVRQAAQTLNVGVLLLVFIPVLGMQALPDAWKAQTGAWAMSVGVDGLLWVSAAMLALLDLALLGGCLCAVPSVAAGAGLNRVRRVRRVRFWR